jgi:hypothetical protein|uniref:Zinc-binding loop region of homing endonuclease domain-containing protein n=2 Tax=Naegleria gruberi TaxID=5762 RepID=A0A2H5CLF8_NAEGR|nr:hypothetical protein [Naegleria gruberi]
MSDNPSSDTMSENPYPKAITHGTPRPHTKLSPSEFEKVCRALYKKYKKSTVRVFRECGIVKCDYALDLCRGYNKTYQVSERNVHLSFHKLRYMATHNSFAQNSGKEHTHICGDTNCCRPSHVIYAPKGTNISRTNCPGYVRWKDNNNKEIFYKVCKHDPPCRVVTDFHYLDRLPHKYGPKAECPGNIEYDGRIIRACKHEDPCETTLGSDEMVFKRKDIDPSSDYDNIKGHTIPLWEWHVYEEYVEKKEEEEERKTEEEKNQEMIDKYKNTVEINHEQGIYEQREKELKRKRKQEEVPYEEPEEEPVNNQRERPPTRRSPGGPLVALSWYRNKMSVNTVNKNIQ